MCLVEHSPLHFTLHRSNWIFHNAGIYLWTDNRQSWTLSYMTEGFDCPIGFIRKDILIVQSGLWLNPEVLENSFYPEQWFTLKMNGRLKEICKCYWGNWLTLDVSNTVSVMTGIHRGTPTMANVIDSEVFQAFSTYATIVILKMMFMSFLTAYFRITRKVTEDTTLAYSEHCSIFITPVVLWGFFFSIFEHSN